MVPSVLLCNLYFGQRVLRCTDTKNETISRCAVIVERKGRGLPMLTRIPTALNVRQVRIQVLI